MLHSAPSWLTKRSTQIGSLKNRMSEVYVPSVENYFAKIKEFRGIATRYDKTDCSYAANWNLAAALIASR